MSKVQIRKRVYQLVIISMAAVIVILLLYRFLLAVAFRDTLIYILFQILCVALPGVAIKRLIRVKLSLLEDVVTSYALGILFNILIYFIFAPFFLTSAIPYVIYSSIPFSLLIIFLTRNKKRVIRFSNTFKISLLLSSFTLIVTFVLLSLSNLSPSVAGARGYNHDLTNSISLITSASFGFPMQFLQMSGTVHYYHPFFFAYCAVVKLSTSLSSFDVGTKFSLISIAPFFTLAFCCMVRRIFRSTKMVVISFIAMILFFPPVIYYVAIDLLGFSLSIAFACCSVLLFFKAQNKNTRYINRYHLLSVLFMVGCLGSKGSNGVTLVFSICFALLLSLIRKGRWLSVTSTGAVYAISFFLTYSLIYRQGAESMILRKDTMLSERFTYYSSMSEAVPSWLRVFLANVRFTIRFNTLAVVCFIVLAISFFILKKNLHQIVDLAFGGLLCGFVLSNMFLQYGSSEMYFLYTAIPFAVVGVYYCFTKFITLSKGKGRIIPYILIALTAIVSIPEAVRTISDVTFYLKDARDYSPYSSSRYLSGERISSISEAKRPAILTPAEYEGLIWIRDNTEKTAVIAEGRYLIYNKYFMGTAFSERRYYLEGWGYVTMEDSNDNTPEKVRRDSVMSLFYGVEEESFIPLLRSYGIDYVVVYQYLNPGWYFKNEFGSSCVFKNNEIAVYDIRY